MCESRHAPDAHPVRTYSSSTDLINLGKVPPLPWMILNSTFFCTFQVKVIKKFVISFYSFGEAIFSVNQQQQQPDRLYVQQQESLDRAVLQ